MSQGSVMTYRKARATADAIVEALAPGCEQIEVVGSVRRKRHQCGDIEVLVVPKFDLDGLAPVSQLNWTISDLVTRKKFGRRIRDGAAWKTYEIVARSPAHVDIFIVSPPVWGVAMAIYTGPAMFATGLVTQRRLSIPRTNKHGLLPDDLTVADGWQLWRNRVRERDERGKWKTIEKGELQPAMTEEQFVTLCCGRWVEPHERDGWIEAWQ